MCMLITLRIKLEIAMFILAIHVLFLQSNFILTPSFLLNSLKNWVFTVPDEISSTNHLWITDS